MSSSGFDKLFVVLEEVRNGLRMIDLKASSSSADILIKFLESVDLAQGVDGSAIDSYLEPIEPLRRYPCTDLDFAQVDNFLKTNGVCVGSFDGSSYDPGAHFRISFRLINVGYWFCNYANGEIKSGNRAQALVDLASEREARLRAKEFEYSVAREVFSDECGLAKVVLYDESFNLKYTLSWDMESRGKMVNLLKNHLDYMVKTGVVPVAVFYTRSSDLYRFYEAYRGEKPIIDVAVQDKFALNRYLSEGERTSLFKVRSKVIEPFGLELYAFYLKTSGGVVRVEFPAQVYDKVDLIHKVVLSQSILGDGYPIALQRAHEWAVLTYVDREVIEEEIARFLGFPYPDMLYSSKRASKRWPIS